MDRKEVYKEVRKALKSGAILKPETCEKCGSVDNIHGHHNNYSKPLDLEWLCIKCHLHKHAQISEAANVMLFPNLRKYRMLAWLTTTEVAAKTGMTDRNYVRIEAGGATTAETGKKLAKLLKINLKVLTGEI